MRERDCFSTNSAGDAQVLAFYIGLFKYGGELHEGKHEPIISKKLCDEAQAVLRRRGQPERKYPLQQNPH